MRKFKEINDKLHSIHQMTIVGRSKEKKCNLCDNINRARVICFICKFDSFVNCFFGVEKDKSINSYFY